MNRPFSLQDRTQYRSRNAGTRTGLYRQLFRNLSLGALLSMGIVAPCLNCSSAVAQEKNATANSIVAANAFLASLNADQKKLSQIPFADQRRTEWHFIPMETRKGLPLRDMTDEQVKFAIQLLSTVLSEKGFQRATNTMCYEGILLELEGPAAAKRRDFKKYYFTIYGTPNDKDQWGLSVEGHHMSLNFTFDRGVIVDSTPQFFGANPATLHRSFTVPGVSPLGKSKSFKDGERLLQAEEDAGIALWNSLNDAQKSQAIFNTQCPEDIQWPGEPQPKPSTPVGLAAKDMTPDQKKLLANAIEAFLSTMPKDVVQARMNLISAAGMDSIYFGWAGATTLNEQHHFRIHGPTFMAEFSNFQKDAEGNIANHIHAVWRDMTGDFNLPVVAAGTP